MLPGPMPPYSTGRYSTDPQEIARANDGLPPEEHVGVVYIASPYELWIAEWRDFWKR